MRDYEHTPIIEIQKWNNIPAGTLLFESILSFENYDLTSTMQAQGGKWINREFNNSITFTNYPISVTGYLGSELLLEIVYSRRRFEDRTIARMLGHIEILLESIVTNPEKRLSDVRMLTEPESKQILVEWNATETTYPVDRSVHQLFEQQVERTPDAVAVVCKDEQLSYRELNTRANQLAHYLNKLGVGPETLVGVFMDRSLEMVISLYGILKAGGAYVPLDPEYPAERIAFMLEDTRVPVLLTQTRLIEKLSSIQNLAATQMEAIFQNSEFICLDSRWETIAQESPDNPVSGTKGENLAYVIYTSGSTGRPKGVMNEHRGICNRLLWMQDAYSLTPEDRVLQKTPFSFDVSVWEFFWPLLFGARLVVALPGGHKDSDYLVNLIVEQEITTLHFVPSMLQAFLLNENVETCQSLKRVICSDEALPYALQERFFARLEAELHNLYGPTEAAVDVTYWACQRDSELSTVPIGRPVANTQIYLLNPQLQPVPVGVPGELHIGGVQVARGYLNRPGLTAEKFISDPFTSDPDARLYRTGDLARYLPDGSILYLGRLDHQVKIRGNRIELGEIEATLDQHPGVRESVVVAHEYASGDKRLMSYVVARHEPTPTFSELRSFLKEKLPDYMIPSAFGYLDSLPLTANGKVDRQALPAPDGVRPELDTAYQAPRAGVEQTLAQIWKQVLGIDQVGRQDNFFELGGDSILSIQIVARANQAGLRVTPRHLFQYQTIAELAEEVEALEPVVADQGAVTGPLPLSPIQHWFFGRQLEAPNHWNMGWVLEARQPVDPEKMKQVVEALLHHHDALRLRIVPHSTGWQQELGAPNQPVPFTFIDLSHLPYAEAAEAFSQEADRLHTTLNLSEGPLIQVALFKFSENQADRVLLVIHHLAVDGISWRILLDDLQAAYDQLCESGRIQLPPKTTSYKEWTKGLVAYAQSSKLHEELSYWEAVANTPFTPLPRDVVEGINTVASTRTVSVGLGPEDTQALLQEIPEVYHTQINDVLLAALVEVLAHWSLQETICLDLEGHGREELLEGIDLSRTVGWFTSIFPVVLKRGTPGHAGELLKSVKEQLRQIPHRGIGYGLLQYVSEDEKVRDQLGNGPDPEVAFNYLGQFDQVIAVDGRWSWSKASAGASRNPQDKQTHLITIGAWIMNNVLQVHWSYSEAVHRRETIENLAQNYLAALVTIIRHCQSPGAGGYTPSDFPLARVSQSDLDRALTGTKSGDGKAVFSDLYPLTPLQQGLWFHTLVTPESGVYFEQSVFRIEGYMNRDALRQAWEKVVEQHAILRTGIIWEGLEHPLQLVRSTVELPWAEVDWRESPDNEHQSRLLTFLDEDRQHGFDLTQAPLMRLTLIQVAETSAILVWSFHHLILDRWSVDLVQQEVWSAYQTLVQGQPLQFNALRPYREYIGWLQGQDIARAEQYWRQLLSGFTVPTVLGVDQAPPTRVGHQESSCDSERVTLSEAATSALSRWARQQQLTVNTVVQGTLAVLLSRYSGSEDVVFGTTVSGRTAGLPGIESMVGLFINTLPVRVEVSPSHSVVPWLTELQEQQVTMREYEYTPLYEIQKWSEVTAGEPLFNTLLVFENIPLESGEKLTAGTAGLNVQRVAGSRGGETNYPLTVVVIPGRTLQVLFTYDTEHYTAEAITRMIGHFQQVLTAMIGDSEQTRLGAIPLLRKAEQQQMLVDWNDTSSKYPRDRCVHQLFEEQVEQSPDAVAVVCGDEQLTYRQLNARANQLAHYLKGFGVGPEVLVGICLERSLEMIIAVLGILKAGGAYVPLDPEYPQERLTFMLSDTQTPALLTQQKLLSGLPETAARLVCLDSHWEAIGKESHANPISDAVAENLAYVIYTSGSTGNPKGVLITHASLCNHMLWRQQAYPLRREDRFLHKASLSFDISVWEIFAPLLAGARLILARPGGQMDSAYLAELVVGHKVTTIHFSPTALQHFLEEKAIETCSSLKRVFCGGEAMSADLKRKFFTCLNAELIHQYGPTETTVDVATWECKPEDDHIAVPIGHPIANTQVYILDGNLQPVPVGVQGELCIGGASLARGYQNRPELTAEKFIANPFSYKKDSRIYKTGDIVRYRNDGTIEFLGRKDFQVKLRGFRIELGEIESVLGQHPAVREAVIIAREDVPGDKRLVTYVVASRESTPTFSELRSFLKEKLPDYMIPSAFVFLDLLPLMPNGKVDRRALPAPEQSRSELENKFVAPGTPVEEVVARIWCEVLGLKKVGMRDNFFDLGGHSLLMMRIHRKLQKIIGYKIPIITLFQYPTIESLCSYLSGEAIEWSSFEKVYDRAERQAKAIQQQKQMRNMRRRFSG
jgi:amino acid adenylation domain-containing protein/non-ribosomal peptide synthase protein (TIGR01720 family)